nr:hypothetical protein [Nocardia sp. 852002-20019_SCH5090214]
MSKRASCIVSARPSVIHHPRSSGKYFFEVLVEDRVADDVEGQLDHYVVQLDLHRPLRQCGRGVLDRFGHEIEHVVEVLAGEHRVEELAMVLPRVTVVAEDADAERTVHGGEVDRLVVALMVLEQDVLDVLGPGDCGVAAQSHPETGEVVAGEASVDPVLEAPALVQRGCRRPQRREALGRRVRGRRRAAVMGALVRDRTRRLRGHVRPTGRIG